MVGICLIWFYRLKNIIPRTTGYHDDHDHDDHQPAEGRRWAWIGMFMAEVGFGLYWVITQSVRWSFIRFYPLKDGLSNRYENMLPGMDIFVCTADPIMEPPTLVINTVLSAMSYNYPPEKLSVYVSDDGGSEFTFYALLEASLFSKHWIPFCKRFNIEPRAPEAYFSQHYSSVQDNKFAQEWLAFKKLYEDMKNRIETVIKLGKVPQETRKRHKGFSEWNLNIKKNDHQSIVQILIDGRDTTAVDNEGSRLPTLVYMAREKRPNWPHNFKAGAINALIRVSSEITNAPFILNLDCDMHSNNADTIREILCFFMDEKKGDEVAFVQSPQSFKNVTKNDIYGSAFYVTQELEFAGMGGYGATPYCGTGCFHRRESLSGKKYSKGHRVQWNIEAKKNEGKSVNDLEESLKVLTSCSYEKDTQWGKEMGLVYGFSVEDAVTGLVIQCRGWKSVYYNPERKAFVGVAPTTLEVCLVQNKRWSEGLYQIFLSKYCPFIYGHGRIKLGAQMGYSIYLLWAPISLPVLFYVIVPSLCLLKGVALFPQIPYPYIYGPVSVFHFLVFYFLWALSCCTIARITNEEYGS
ncbi:Cellulose synthase-like protein E1 [Morus notabilis]|uniref:Cellulose synthase-like protein E1 n=1 Tax=Morus notabilis TaxID=981085 RepID=W9QYI5_9ROSA|nr:Cellulose synthase-like protein E1 [Morus notabilis]